MVKDTEIIFDLQLGSFSVPQNVLSDTAANPSPIHSTEGLSPGDGEGGTC